MKPFNKDEESTRIEKVIALRISIVKALIIVPALAFITGLFFMLLLYWYP